MVAARSGRDNREGAAAASTIDHQDRRSRPTGADVVHDLGPPHETIAKARQSVNPDAATGRSPLIWKSTAADPSGSGVRWAWPRWVLETP